MAISDEDIRLAILSMDAYWRAACETHADALAILAGL